jgi:hypothetical protein
MCPPRTKYWQNVQVNNHPCSPQNIQYVSMEEDIRRTSGARKAARGETDLCRSMLVSIMLGAILAVTAFPALATSRLVIDESLSYVNLSDKVEYYEDITGQLSYEQVMLVPDDLWQSNNQPVLSLGFSNSQYWFRLRIKSNAVFKLEPVISIVNPHLSTVNLYNLMDGQVVQYLKAGSSTPYSQKPNRHRYPILPLKLSPTA